MRKVDWRAYCRDYGIQANPKLRKGEWLEVRCPFCDDHETHGGLNVRSSSYTCWKCGKHSIKEFVGLTAATTSEYRDVMRALEPYLTEAYIPTAPTRPKRDDSVVKVERTLKLPGSTELGPYMRKYLKQRGFNPDYMASKYGLRDGGIAGKWAYRLMIPVNVDGKLVAWQGRSVSKENKLRYMASSLDESVMDIKDTIYNMDNCHRDRVIVVEGVFDCWKLGDDCVAMFGISLKDSQIRLLASRFKEVYILFDPEERAQEQALTLSRKLSNLGVKTCVLNMGDTESEDPGDLTPDEVKYIKSFVFSDVVGYDSSTPWLLNHERS